MAISKEYPYRFDVSRYPRVIKPLDSTLPRCKCELTLKDAMTVAVTDRVLQRIEAPVTIDTVLMDLRNCHFLWRVGFDTDRIKEICQIRTVQLRYPHWNGKSRDFRNLLKRMEKGMKELKLFALNLSQVSLRVKLGVHDPAVNEFFRSLLK